MLSYWAYILIGSNNTGKTRFQKYLIAELCGPKKLGRLELNRDFPIIHPQMPRGGAKLSAMNSSYQEQKKSNYKNVANFFQEHFTPAEICILSSHATKSAEDDLKEMMEELRRRAYNVAGVFFINEKYNEDTKKIASLNWDERLRLDNPYLNSETEIEAQIKRLAEEFAQFLIARARLYSGSASDDIASGESG